MRRRRVTLATGLPESHHVPRLIRRGMDPVCAARGAEVATVHHGSKADRALMKLLGIGRTQGVILSSWDGVPDVIRRHDGSSLIVLAEHLNRPLAPGLAGWVFDWRAAATEALAWVMSDHEGLTHRLYRPQWKPAHPRTRVE
jgi:hypothetical protein